MRHDQRPSLAVSAIVVALALLRGIRRPQFKYRTDAPHTEARRGRVERRSETDIFRIIWERSRATKIMIFIVSQGILWTNLFGTARGYWTGPVCIVPWTVTVATAIYLLVEVARFGSLLDILVSLLYAFSTLTAIFSTLYWNYGTAANFSHVLTRLDAIYFTVGTMTTAGTGNINASSEVARGLQILQMVLDLGLVVFAVGLVVAELSSRTKRTTSRVEPPPSS
jgi:Ion channel